MLNIITYNNIIKLVTEILDENYISSPPIRIEELVRIYGLNVTSVIFEGDLGGIAGLLDPDKKMIYVDTADSAGRKAFTIAHELGHWMLHKEIFIENPKGYILYRKPLGRPNDDLYEKEANYFAAQLLVPEKFLNKYINYDINTIAKIFGVSAEVIGFRLKDEYGRS